MDERAQAMFQNAVATQAAIDFRRKIINSGIFVVNFTLTIGILMGLNTIGWIHMRMPGVPEMTVAQTAILAAVIALIYAFVRKLVGMAYGLITLATCCLSLLILPVFGVLAAFISLWGVQLLLPDWFSLSSNLLLAAMSGVAVGLGHIPEISEYSPPEMKKEETPEDKVSARIKTV
jgi:hypothetical protein